MPNVAKKTETILALDPGLRALGWAVLSGKRLLASGVLPLRFHPEKSRLSEARASLIRLIRGYRPNTLVLEHIPKRPLDALGGLPALGRSVLRLVRRFRLKLAVYSARAARRTVVGDGWAGKAEAAEAIVARFPQLRVHLTHDRKWKVAHWWNMFDAAALAIHHQLVRKPPSRSRRSG